MANNGYIQTITGLGSYIIRLNWSVKQINITTNTSNIGWELVLYSSTTMGGLAAINSRTYHVTINGTRFSGTDDINIKGSIGARNSKVLASGSLNIPHSEDGTKSISLAFEQQWDIVGDGTQYYRGEGSATISPIPRPVKVTSAQDLTDENTTPTIRYNNVRDGYEPIYSKLEACVSLYDYGILIPYEEIELNGGSYTFSDNVSIANVLDEYFNDKKYYKTTVNYIIRTTFSTGEVLEESYGAPCYLVNHAPTLNPIVWDARSRTAELTGNPYNTMIRYESEAAFIVGAQGQRGADIEYRTIINGNQLLDDYASDTGIMPEPITSNTFYFSATDTRGATANDFKTVNLIPYDKFTASFTEARMSSTGDISFSLKGIFYNGSFGAENNNVQLQISLRDSKGNIVPKEVMDMDRERIELGDITSDLYIDGSYYTYDFILDNADEVVDYREPYKLIVTIGDALNQVEITTPIIPAIPVFDWGKDDFHLHADFHLEKDKKMYIVDSDAGTRTELPYIVEWGTKDDDILSTVWHYRKWSNGFIEMYGIQTIFNLACNVALGGWYRTNVITPSSYPFVLREVVNAHTQYYSQGYGALVWATTNTTIASPAAYYLIRPTSSTGISGKTYYYVSGYLDN